MSVRRGLPDQKQMRHDYHFVEELTNRFDEAVEGAPTLSISIDKIVTNPHQPRNDLGDLSELVSSIKERGILQPLVVREEEEFYTLVCGERRLRAAQKAGFEEVPCVFVEVEDDELLEIALMENLQRKDLSVFEEADGLQQLIEDFGYTHREIADRLGRSRSTVTETLKLCELPAEIRSLAEKAGLTAKSTLLQIAREEDPNRMLELVDRITSGEVLSREELVEERRRNSGEKKRGRPRHFKFRFAPETSDFRLNLQFNRAKVSRQEVIRALREALERLMEGEDEDWG